MFEVICSKTHRNMILKDEVIRKKFKIFPLPITPLPNTGRPFIVYIRFAALKYLQKQRVKTFLIKFQSE